MVRHFPILENSETELYVDPRNGRRNNTTRSALVHCTGAAQVQCTLLPVGVRYSVHAGGARFDCPD